jgi:HAD superfamily hydrolase (TIGR01509 family)
MLHPSLIGARACVFDAGGTLIHPDWPRLARLAADVAGREFGPAEMGRAMGETLKGLGLETQKTAAPASGETNASDETKRTHWVFRRVFAALGLDDAACDCVAGRLDAAHEERHLWCGPDPDAPRMLEELRREGLRLAVISNTEDGRLRDALEAAGIASHFELLLDSHLVGRRKPDPAIFRMALEGLGVEAHEAAFVGDSYAHDALAARDAGLRAILLDPFGLRPDSVCPRVERLGDLIPRAV